MGFFSGLGKFFMGTPGKMEQRSTLLPQQQAGFSQLQQAGQGRGAGGAFGTSADYYRDILSNDPASLQAFQDPEMRQFREQTIPGIAEQFAGMGAGGLSSSGFRTAALGAGTDLGERLASMRAGLRQGAAERLSNIGSQGLGTFAQNYYRPATQGFLGAVAPGIGAGLGMLGGGAFGSLAGLSSRGQSQQRGVPSRGGNDARGFDQYNPYTGGG